MAGIQNNKIRIIDMDLTVRTKNVLTMLGVDTVADLHTMYVLDTIPKVGTVVRWMPLARYVMTYSKRVNEEVKEILHLWCGIEELENVGA